MIDSPTDRLSLLSRESVQSLLADSLYGVEKESLRVDSTGRIAKTPHPRAIGSALTHPAITTDYSEALLEFITEPMRSASAVLDRLDQIHRFVANELPSGEVLWSNSMPCQLGADGEIPVADYGSSNVGRMKRVYRLGLGHRYSRKMQTIAGIHFNFSVPDTVWELLRAEEKSSLPLQEFRTQGYMGLVRNFRRWYWLLIYLMGASPAICRSFVAGQAHQLVALGSDEHTLHAPYGTSLRMGDLGYQSSAQETLYVCYNDLESYIRTLQSALTTSYPEYSSIGEYDEQGERIQLNDHILQIENEFYSAIRPKQPAQSGETQLRALAARGVEYIEVRCLDLNPFSQNGIELDQMLFIETFLLACLAAESPETSPQESTDIQTNQKRIVYQGRQPGLHLERLGQTLPLQDWGAEILRECEKFAVLLDDIHQSSGYSAAVEEMTLRLRNPEQTLSAKVIKRLGTEEKTYFGWAMSQSEKFTQAMQSNPLPKDIGEEFMAASEKSLREQVEIERGDAIDFETYIARYFAQYADP